MDSNQQCPGKDELGNQEKNPGSWKLPGRSIGPDAGVGQTEAGRGDPVGIEALPSASSLFKFWVKCL